MASRSTNGSATNAGRDAFNIHAQTLFLNGSMIGGGTLVDAPNGVLSTPAAPNIRNNFSDAQIVQNLLFTGRVTELSRLHKALTEKSQAIIHAVIGAGGVGKTELAREFAIKYADEFDGVWWIDASDRGFADSVSRLFAIVTAKAAPESTKVEDLVKRLMTLWSGGKHLIILDNLDSQNRLALFAAGGDCRILATTRTDLSSAATVEPFKIDVISESDAVQLLQKQTERRDPPIEHEHLLRIVQELGCHTLAVALAGAYLAQYADVSALDYLSRLQSQGVGEVEPREDGEENDPLLLRYRHSVQSCLTLHFVRFKGEPTLSLLCLMSFCHSTEIPLELIAKAASIELAKVRVFVRRLADVSIVQYHEKVSVHRLTQIVMRSMLHPKPRSEFLEMLANTLSAEFAECGDHKKWPSLSLLATHAAAVIAHGAGGRATPALGMLANSLGQYFRQIDNVLAAKQVFEIGLRFTEEAFGPTHKNMGAALSNVAMIQKDFGDHVGALATIEKAIAIDHQYFPDDAEIFATRYTNLAMIQLGLGDVDSALTNMKKAISIDQKYSDADNATFSLAYSNLSSIQLAKGDLLAARASVERAIAIHEKNFDGDDPVFAIRYSNLATVQMRQNDLAGARLSLERAIAIQNKYYHPISLTIATTYNNLAHVDFAEGRNDAACSNWKKALMILLKLFGESHEYVTLTRAALKAAGGDDC